MFIIALVAVILWGNRGLSAYPIDWLHSRALSNPSIGRGHEEGAKDGNMAFRRVGGREKDRGSRQVTTGWSRSDCWKEGRELSWNVENVE